MLGARGMLRACLRRPLTTAVSPKTEMQISIEEKVNLYIISQDDASGIFSLLKHWIRMRKSLFITILIHRIHISGHFSYFLSYLLISIPVRIQIVSDAFKGKRKIQLECVK